ncbi:carboxymuconolactone decarboxylase family protein [Actinosynnema sp. NPDC020468]|uniref:carboxymuconolactone decarboxylase family protein n=1 Tax=Actinosynnema sp. NPDC020468 TaxID=3154488 RepID=UPI0034053019
MPHISLGSPQPGISGLMDYRPETGGQIKELAEELLRGQSTLSRGERELIAAHVSKLNECAFCSASHSALAEAQLPEDHQESPKLSALLAIAAATVGSGKNVTAELVAAAREHGADDREIHDTVLIGAFFAMMNRYVDGLATWAPDNPEDYRMMAKHIVANGYLDA